MTPFHGPVSQMPSNLDTLWLNGKNPFVLSIHKLNVWRVQRLKERERHCVTPSVTQMS